MIVWTEELTQKFRDLWATNMSLRLMAVEFGVSRNSIAGKAYRLGFTKRKPWPAKKDYCPGAKGDPRPAMTKVAAPRPQPLFASTYASAARANYAASKTDMRHMFEDAWANTSKMREEGTG
jgi:hypothetical protein